MELKYLIDAGAYIGGFYILWQILKVVLDYRKNRPLQPIATNGTAMEMIKIFHHQTTILERMVQVNEDHKAISLANGFKLEKIDTNLMLAMDRQQETRKVLDDLKREQQSKR